MLSKTRMLFAALLLSALPCLTNAAAQEPANSPEQLARELIRLTGAEDAAEQVLHQLIALFKDQMPGAADEFWSEFESSVDMGQLIELTVPIYVEHLTVEEMTAAIEFYKTPAGRSLVEKLPTVMQESIAVGAAWGERLALDVTERLAKYKQQHPDA